MLPVSITALTAQNTTGVYGILETPADFIAAQMDAVFSDIFPDAVKIGMLPSPDAMECVASKLRQYKPKHIVLDPGHGIYKRTSSDGIRKPKKHSQGRSSFPLAELITPNIPEAEVLTKLLIGDDAFDGACMPGTFRKIPLRQSFSKAGTGTDHANDLLYTGDESALDQR